MSFKADLHCHSTFSDGLLDPQALFQLAQKKGLSALSITDHDTVGAYLSAIKSAEETGLKLLSGVEFSSQHKQESIHILAYAFSLDDPEILKLCERQKEMRIARNTAICANLKRLYGIDILLDESERGSIGRVHIALELVRQGYAENIKEAFHKYVGDKKPAYVFGEKLSIEEVIEIIHKSRGKAILAHPHLIRKRRLLRDLLEMDLDGIEVYYASMMLSEEKRILEIAKAKGWLKTGGSDFHGEVKPYCDLGCAYTDEVTFTTLYDLFKTNTETL